MFDNILQTVRKLKREYGRKRLHKALPLKGFTQHSVPTKYVDTLSDTDLMELNQILNWHCFTIDGMGRRFGNAAWEGKRCDPQVIPDRRISLLNEWFDLSDKHVLELGCFEGIHTIGLAHFAGKVTAVDSRIENVVKTIVRCSLFGLKPEVFKVNIEEEPLNTQSLLADIAHHVGVLYHLKNPVRHLLSLGSYIRLGMMLDTHYCLPGQANEDYEVNGRTFRHRRYAESGAEDVFSGMYDHAKWLKLDDIVGLIQESGFANVEIIETRNERNGPRVLLMAKRR